MDEGGFILDYRAPPGGCPGRDRPAGARARRHPPRRPRRAGVHPAHRQRARLRGHRPEQRRLHRAAQAAEPALRVGIRRDRSRAPRPPRNRRRRCGWSSCSCCRTSSATWRGRPQPVELKLFSADQAAAERAARRGGQGDRAGVRGWWTCSMGSRATTPSCGSISIRCASPGWGSSSADVEAQARAALFGAEAGTAREPDRSGADPGAGPRQRPLSPGRGRRRCRSSARVAGSRWAGSGRCVIPPTPASCCGRTCGRWWPSPAGRGTEPRRGHAGHPRRCRHGRTAAGSGPGVRRAARQPAAVLPRAAGRADSGGRRGAAGAGRAVQRASRSARHRAGDTARPHRRVAHAGRHRRAASTSRASWV